MRKPTGLNSHHDRAQGLQATWIAHLNLVTRDMCTGHTCVTACCMMGDKACWPTRNIQNSAHVTRAQGTQMSQLTQDTEPTGQDGIDTAHMAYRPEQNRCYMASEAAT